MPIRITIDTSRVSFKFLGLVMVGGGLVLLVIRAPLAVCAVLIASGILARRSPNCFILFPADKVLTQVENTLTLLMLTYRRASSHIVINATHTVIRVSSLGPVSYLSFGLADHRSVKEACLAAALVKCPFRSDEQLRG